MKYKSFNYLLLVAGMMVFISCTEKNPNESKIRPLADTIGFAQYDWQMDSIVERIHRIQVENINDSGTSPKVVISPHDDYSYAGYLYPQALENIKASTIFLFGVAHKARVLNLEDQIIFDSYDYWKAPYGNVKVSSIREEIIELLPIDLYQVNDSMQQMEHSVEAIIPWLQYYNEDIEIVSILVPYMSFDRMTEISKSLSEAIKAATNNRNWIWGTDYAFVISNDAVHYGDEDWGGKNFARYGTDSLGYSQAIAHEKEIITTISGKLTQEKVKQFTSFTIQENDHKEYKWTWCGRYSIPLGLLTAINLQTSLGNQPLQGSFIGYSNSIDHAPIPVDDLGMGITAPASMRHWVGYAAIGYR